MVASGLAARTWHGGRRWAPEKIRYRVSSSPPDTDLRPEIGLTGSLRGPGELGAAESGDGRG